MGSIQMDRGGHDRLLTGLADACAKSIAARGLTRRDVAVLMGRQNNAELGRLLAAVRRRQVDGRYDSVSRLFTLLDLRVDAIIVTPRQTA